MRRIGSLLTVVGATLLVAAGLWQLGLLPGSRVSVPEPVALRQARMAPQAAIAPASPAHASTHPTATSDPVAAVPDPARQRDAADAQFQLDTQPALWRAADHHDRLESVGRPRVGYAARLAIPAIELETPVRQAGLKRSRDGALEWETLPFVAAHYGELTALIGGPGNAVIAGHVVTLNEGNVFRSLYRVELGDEVLVWVADEADEPSSEPHRYQVEEVMLVPPTEVSVMARTATPTLTLITCGGTFDPIKREFSDRLVVVARPMR